MLQKRKFQSLTVIALICWLCFFLPDIQAQAFTIPSPKDEAKENYNYILIYRNWEAVWQNNSGAMYSSYDWVTKIEGFRSWDDLIKWMNSSNYWDDGKKRVRLTEDELIGVYDITRAEKIKLELKTEEKVLPKRIELKEEKWTDYEWKEQGKK